MGTHRLAPFIQTCGFLTAATVMSTLGCTSGGPDGSGRTMTPPPPTATVPQPVLSPLPGSYTDSVSISISSTKPGAHIFYTLDGTMPTGASTTYAGPVAATPQALDEPTAWRIQAIAVVDGVSSAVTVGLYAMSYSHDPSPVLSPTAGTYTSPQLVAITSFATSADLYYTLDGSEPSYLPGGSTYRYVAPIPIDKTTTIKAWAVAYHSATPVVTATYTF